MKIAITQPRMIQIPKFWCLKSCTNIWLHFGNIHSIQKINRIELEGKKGSKFAKIGQFFTLQKIKIEFSQKFPKVWFHGFFLSLPTYETFDISLKKFLRTGQVWWERCTGGVSIYWWIITPRGRRPRGVWKIKANFLSYGSENSKFRQKDTKVAKMYQKVTRFGTNFNC